MVWGDFIKGMGSYSLRGDLRSLFKRRLMLLNIHANSKVSHLRKKSVSKSLKYMSIDFFIFFEHVEIIRVKVKGR